MSYLPEVRPGDDRVERRVDEVDLEAEQREERVREVRVHPDDGVPVRGDELVRRVGRVGRDVTVPFFAIAGDRAPLLLVDATRARRSRSTGDGDRQRDGGARDARAPGD
jgi:hypothetical protein